jgi:hypothetical protein
MYAIYGLKYTVGGNPRYAYEASVCLCVSCASVPDFYVCAWSVPLLLDGLTCPLAVYYNQPFSQM